MIIQRLVELARREKLTADPAFEPSAKVRWLLPLDANGTPQGFIANSRSCDIPKVGNRNSQVQARLLVDDLSYVLGVFDKPDNKDKARRHHEAFVALAREAAGATADPGAVAARRFLDGLEQGAIPMPDFHAARVKVSDQVALAFHYPEGLQPVFERAAARDFWRSQAQVRRQERAERSRVAECLCCGRLGPTLDSHDKVKPVPGANPVGASLVSADKAAFASYGFESSQNSPTCAECADAYVRALNRLLSDRASSTRLPGDVVYCYWTREPVDGSAVSLIDEPTAEAVERLLTAPWRGRGGESLEANRFYAVALSGNGGRAVVRDWLELDVWAVQENVRRWFADLRVVPLARNADMSPPSLHELLRAVGRPKADRKVDVSPRTGADLFRCALTGECFPEGLLADVVQRLRAEHLKGFRPTRVGLLRAVLRRLPAGKGADMTEALDQTRADPAYLCGRLLAALASLQYAANRATGATVIDKFYGAASTAPRVVFPQLLRLAQNHLGKLRSGGKPGLAISIDQDLQAIIARLPEFPDVLDLEEQGLFAIGFYHQRAHQFRGGDAAAAADGSDE